MKAEQVLTSAEFEHRRAAFLDEMQSEAVSPPQGDPIIGAFNEAAYEVYHSEPGYRATIDRYLQIERIGTPSYLLNKFYKPHQKALMPQRVRNQVAFPDIFSSAAVWKEWLTETYADPKAPASQELRYWLSQPLQVNRPERAKVPAFLSAIQSMRHAFTLAEEAAVVHEYGSAADLVLRAFALRMMGNARVIDQHGNEDQPLSFMFNLLTHTARLGEGVTVEARPPKTEEDRAWVAASTLGPSQLNSSGSPSIDTVEEDRLMTLFGAQPPAPITSLEGNFLRLSRYNQQVLTDKPADIVFLSHVLSQNRRRTERVIRGILPYMNPRGIIAINEYAGVDPRNPQHLKFLDRWYSQKWLCQTIVLDLADPDRQFRTLFTWETSRCEQVQINQDELTRLAPHLLA